MNDIAISVRNVSKCYRVFEDQRSRLLHAIWPKYSSGMQEVWALKDINFDIKRGEAVALIGRNGGGKSTLLEILTGTLAPSSGEVKVNGRVSALLELGSGFNPEYSGRDNVMLNGLLLGLTREDILGRFAEIEAFAEIGAAIDRPVKTYSSGMMMRLAFAVQVLCEPDILIIDEALSVGDFFFQQKCLSFIRGLCAKGVTLLFVSHDMGTVRDICERGMYINAGYIGFDGSNLEAIHYYLQAGCGTNVLAAQKNNLTTISADTDHLLNLVNPFWIANAEGVPEAKQEVAYLVSVGIFDLDGNAVTSVRMGSRVKFKAHFRTLCHEPIHVHLVIKNKYDQILTAVGSYNMSTPMPVLEEGQEAIFELDIQLSLEAGEYVFNISLTQAVPGRIEGKLIDETPWLGPFQISWNYNEDIPPFYGLTGMNCSGKFLL